MNHLSLAVLLWFVSIAAAAQPVPRTPKLGQAVATARLAVDGVHATIELDRSVTRFSFAQADVVRDGEIELITPGLTFKGDEVTSAKPFHRFALRIRPATKERDAKYPAHYRLGDGGVLYAPALVGDPAVWRTRLRFATAPGQIRLPSTGVVDDSFVYIGPAALRTEVPGVTVVSAPGTPAWLVDTLADDLADGVRAYTSALGTPLPRKPLLLLKHEVRSDRTQADVTPGGIVAFRLYGALPPEPDAATRGFFRPMMFHEAFHFWNGGLAAPVPGTPIWLHEGGAEYASLLGGLAAGSMTEEAVQARLAQDLDRCRSGLQNQGDKAMSKLAFLDNRVRYPCGAVIQWAADMHMRRASAGRRAVLDAWADTVRVARSRPSRTYALRDFYAAAGIDAATPLHAARLLVEESGPARWGQLTAALRDLGAGVSVGSTSETRKGALIFHLLGENCRAVEGENVGYTTLGRTITLDSHAGCGLLAGEPVLRSVEGGDPFEMAAATYAVVQAKCAAGKDVALTLGEGRPVAIACRKPLPLAPEAYVVARWRPELVSSSGREPSAR